QEKDPGGIVKLAQALRATRGLEDGQLETSLRLHLGYWSRQVPQLRRRFSPSQEFDFMASALSTEGKVLYIGRTANKETLRLWEAASGKPLGPSLHHRGLVEAVALSPDGNFLLTGCDNGVAVLWNVVNGKPTIPPLKHQGEVNAVAFSPDGKAVLTG